MTRSEAGSYERLLESTRLAQPVSAEPAVEVTDRGPTGWGSLPILTLVAAVGLLALASAYVLAVTGSAASEPLFWLGFLVIGGPITIRLAASSPARRERLGLVIVLGLALYLTSVLRSPEAFTGYDELLHFRSLSDVITSGRLFQTNPLLSVSPLYPGLEIITAAVVQVSGADPFMAAVTILGLVRVLFAVALFGLYFEASGSERLAGLASAIYMLNPNFTFFDSQFAYESLGVPLVPVLLLTIALRARRTSATRWLSLAIVAVAMTLVITHHVTTYVTAAILVAWFVIHLLRRRRDWDRGGPIAAGALLVGVGGAIWLLAVASVTFRYLGGPLGAAVDEFVRLIASGEARTPFESATGQLAPLWERLVGLGTAGLLTLAIPLGLIPLVRYLRDSSLALVLGLLALGYPLSLLGRLMPTASEAAGRSLALISLGLAFVAALAALQLIELPAAMRAGSAWLRRTAAVLTYGAVRLVWWGAFAAAVAVLVLGGVVIGSAPSTRFPGAYLVGADARSIDNASTDAALWTRETFGLHQRVAADRVNRLLLGAYAEADVVFHGSAGIESWRIFVTPVVGPKEIALLEEGRIRYILIDRRLSSSLPLIPFYYEEGEVFYRAHLTPLSPDVLAKWDKIGRVDRIYDSGVIQIYRVDGLYRDQ